MYGASFGATALDLPYSFTPMSGTVRDGKVNGNCVSETKCKNGDSIDVITRLIKSQAKMGLRWSTRVAKKKIRRSQIDKRARADQFLGRID